MLAAECRECEKLNGTQDPHAQSAARAGNAFLDYIASTWMPPEMWRSWSQFGWERAAMRLNITLSKILTTTNHLELFNGALKRKYIHELQHSGYCLRFDVLIYHLINSILPHVYARYRSYRNFLEWRESRFPTVLVVSGLNISTATTTPHSTANATTSPTSTSNPYESHLIWFTPDNSRDLLARTVFESGKLHPIPSILPFELWASCESYTVPVTSDALGIRKKTYWLMMHPCGAGTCTCPDWLNHAGACKHLRVFRMMSEEWLRKGLVKPPFTFAATKAEADLIHARNRAWYGDQYAEAITLPNLSIIQACQQNVTATNKPAAYIAAHSEASPTIPILPPPSNDSYDDETGLPSLTMEAELETYSLESIVDDIRVDVHSTATRSISESSSSHLALLHAVTALSATQLDQEQENLEAIRIQFQQHVEHDMRVVLPNLHGIANHFRHSETQISLRQSSVVTELTEVTNLLDDILRHIPEEKEVKNHHMFNNNSQSMYTPNAKV